MHVFGSLSELSEIMPIHICHCTEIVNDERKDGRRKNAIVYSKSGKNDSLLHIPANRLRKPNL